MCWMMYQIAINYLKTRLPGVTADRLVTRYEQELLDHVADDIVVVGHVIGFAGPSDYKAGAWNSKYEAIKQGKIAVLEQGGGFVVSLDAEVDSVQPAWWKASFSSYFTHLRDKIERELQGW